MLAITQTVTTQVVRSVREVHSGKPRIRQALSLQQLTQIILDGQLQDDSERPVKNGRKRSAPSVSCPKKRAKVVPPSPDRGSPGVLGVEAERRLLVFAHKFELAYTVAWKDGELGVTNGQQYAQDQEASDLGWLHEEEQFLDILSGQNALHPRALELGDVTLGFHQGVMQLYIGSRPEPEDDEDYHLRYLATLPADLFPNRLQNERTRHVFDAFFSLLRAGHVTLSASATLLHIPGVDSPELPIQLHVTVYVSLMIPTIFFPLVLQVPSVTSIGEQRRRFLTYVFCHHQRSADGLSLERKEVPMDPRQFYSILGPAPPINSPKILEALQPQGLHATLLPFQKRTLMWLLEHERKTINSCGQIVSRVESPDELPLFWQRVHIPISSITTKETQSTWYYNRLTGSFMEELPPQNNIAGAMLCEEMGLGKTLECIALMLLNPATGRNPDTSTWDVQTELEVSPVKTNLIVTPATLLQQWLDELSRHAPGLKVLSFTGYHKVKFLESVKDNKESEVAGQLEAHRSWCSFIQGYDVVVTTYNILSQELGVAKAPIIRPKRKVASYSHVEKPRSPLVRVEWARVFMDEVQLVGGGKTAEMVSLIPRDVSIAVSGTPAKSKVSDLSHVLKFLRVEQAIGSAKTWDSLLKPEFRDLFSELCKKYIVRTLKSTVENELTIPSQRRFAIGIELGKAERHIYDWNLQDALAELGVDDRGVATSQGWQLDISLLRSWLRRLRQFCTHPQVGVFKLSKSPTKSINAKTIKTIEEVLQSYQEQNWNALIVETRNKIQHRIRRAQLLQMVDNNVERYQHARDLLLSAQSEVEQLLNEVKGSIAAHEQRGKEIIAEAAVRRRYLKEQEGYDSNMKGKGKAQDLESPDEYDIENDGLPRTQLGDDHRARQRNMQGRLREVYELLHKVAFFLGDVYHVLGASLEEEASYAAAEDVRKTLLKSSEQSANSAIDKLISRDRPVLKQELKLTYCQKGGIRTFHLMEEANEILELLNEQGNLLWKWGAHIFALITQKLSSAEGEQPDGEEYARTLDTQGEAEVYLEAYAALLADRKEVLIAERTALAMHDAREIKFRETITARNANEVLQPEDEVLQFELAEERKGLRVNHSTAALKAIMYQLSWIGNRVGERPEETQIAKYEAKRLRQIISDQGAVMEKIELELGSFRKVFNERIQYFRQLQGLSDSVVQQKSEDDIQREIELTKADEERATLQANARRAGQRHLINLEKDRAGGGLDEEDCGLCREAIQHGLMTPCGHIFCEACLTRWLHYRGVKRTHLDCPMCRSNIDIEALQRISLTDLENKLQECGEPKLPPNHLMKFNTLPQNLLKEIKDFEVLGSYGSKITHLVRHLLYLQSLEPGTKSVVFSTWSDSLTIIQRALVDHGMGCIRVDQKGKRDAAQVFKSDPGVLVFLLHGERENAGLNLTCAKRVWLIEPTVNHAFEVQAISRVDRMGQTSATEVYCYYIQDTVEENILRMGARQGFSLYTQDHSGDAINISDYAIGVQKVPVDAPSKEKQKGDFIASAKDLVHVLFPHLDSQEEDLENLMDISPSDREDEAFSVASGPSTNRTGHVNEIAGPSRLRP